jgi:hypothetical protein
MNSIKFRIYRTVLHRNKISKPDSTLPGIDIPEIYGISFKCNMCPGIPYPVMMVMISRLYTGKYLSAGRPERMYESASFINGVDSCRRINCPEIILKEIPFSPYGLKVLRPLLQPLLYPVNCFALM